MELSVVYMRLQIWEIIGLENDVLCIIRSLAIMPRSGENTTKLM